MDFGTNSFFGVRQRWSFLLLFCWKSQRERNTRHSNPHTDKHTKHSKIAKERKKKWKEQQQKIQATILGPWGWSRAFGFACMAFSSSRSRSQFNLILPFFHFRFLTNGQESILNGLRPLYLSAGSSGLSFFFSLACLLRSWHELPLSLVLYSFFGIGFFFRERGGREVIVVVWGNVSNLSDFGFELLVMVGIDCNLCYTTVVRPKRERERERERMKKRMFHQWLFRYCGTTFYKSQLAID